MKKDSLWRPEGWDKIVARITSQILDVEGHDGDPDLVEAGADAMLEALRARALNFSPDQFSVWVTKKMAHRGKFVFIPDDKEG